MVFDFLEERRTPFVEMIKEISKPREQRKGFVRKRREPFSITDERLNELFDTYFMDISKQDKTLTLKTSPSDYTELVYLFRVHFEVWIEVEAQNITVYMEFPRRFRLIKDMNSPNFNIQPKGKIMYYGTNIYGCCNRANGIPLLLDPPKKPYGYNVPVVQVNYDYIEAIRN